jgi:translation initiation factor 5
MEQNGKLYLTGNQDTLFDPNYRYQIPTIEISHMIKKGTKITILSNLDSFCKDLDFDKEILLNVIAKKLSCRKSNDYLVGEYSNKEIKDIIYNFIQKYLLCQKCDKPEVVLKYKKDKIKQKCKACGNNDYIIPVDDIIVKLLKAKEY